MIPGSVIQTLTLPECTNDSAGPSLTSNSSPVSICNPRILQQTTTTLFGVDGNSVEVMSHECFVEAFPNL